MRWRHIVHAKMKNNQLSTHSLGAEPFTVCLVVGSVIYTFVLKGERAALRLQMNSTQVFMLQPWCQSSFCCSCHCSGATKGALDMLTKVMALELGPHQVPSRLDSTATSLDNLDHILAH